MAGRDARAQEQGWRTYGQRRYWTARWSRQVAERLAKACCDGHKEPERAGSIMCRSCNAIVNPPAPPGESRRQADWRARLVNLAADVKAGRIKLLPPREEVPA